MPQANVEIVRRAYQAFVRGDLEAAAAVLDSDVKYDWIDPGPQDCHNAEEVMQLAQARMVEGFVGELREIIDAGDNVVIVVENPDPQRYGAAPGETAATTVLTLREGRIVAMQDYRSRADALTAVGLT
jgi:ketosteroid isomerase-like protein